MREKLLIMTIMGLLLIHFGSSYLWAGEVDILINKLVEKKILTQSEAHGLLEEMQKEGARQEEEIKQVAADAVKEGVKDKFGLPDWVENTEFEGDVRVRYQTQDMDNDGKPSRSRGRMRVRAGIESTVNDNWMAGIGMASGSDDPRSNNQTFDDTFSTKGWNLDYAFAQYSPNKAFNFIAGKIKNPLWKTKDLIWDSDINPEGIAAQFKYKITDKLEFFAIPAYFLVEEVSGSKNDPALLTFQPGINWKINDNTNLKFAGAYYDFKDVKGSDLSVHSAGTNSTIGGLWAYDHDAIGFDAEVGMKMHFFIPYAALFGQYVVSDADDSVDLDGYDDDTGWLIGLKFGDEKIKDLGDWQFTYNYRELEKDAWVDFWPDSDFYDGETGVKGSEFELVIGLAENITFGLDYYKSKPIRRNIGMDESLLQADLIVKF